MDRVPNLLVELVQGKPQQEKVLFSACFDKNTFNHQFTMSFNSLVPEGNGARILNGKFINPFQGFILSVLPVKPPSLRWMPQLPTHDDIIKWKHFPRYWPFVRGFPAQRPVTRSFDVFFDLHLNKRWVNDGEGGDLRRHRAHYDVIVMWWFVNIGLWQGLVSSSNKPI